VLFLELSRATFPAVLQQADVFDQLAGCVAMVGAVPSAPVSTPATNALFFWRSGQNRGLFLLAIAPAHATKNAVE